MLAKFLEHVSSLHNVVRWSTMFQSKPETVAAHSFDVAIIAHLLASYHLLTTTESPSWLGNTILGAIYHDMAEALTGDVITPTKYGTRSGAKAIHKLERLATKQLADLLPSTLENAKQMLIGSHLNQASKEIIKEADTISAFLKAKTEVDRGNLQYLEILQNLTTTLQNHKSPRVIWFIGQLP